MTIISNIILQASNLSIGYKRGRKILKQVHSGLNFTLKTGELTCLLGPNGAGKSTLLRTLGASQPAISGLIILNNKPLSTYKENEISRTIGLVLTEKTFAGALKVRELVALGRHPHTGFFGRLSPFDEKIIDQSLIDVGILYKQDSYVAELSDGERQKVMIAKALAQESPIIILDEPTSFLDIISRIEIINLLQKLAREKNKAILLSTHDLEQALSSADTLWLLSKQKGLQVGTPEDLIFSEALNELFSHPEILFDKTSGNFRRISSFEIPISVQGNRETIFWIKNLINRYGYRIAETNEISSLHLIVHTPNQIEVVTNMNEKIILHSFYALSKFLKGYDNHTD